MAYQRGSDTISDVWGFGSNFIAYARLVVPEDLDPPMHSSRRHHPIPLPCVVLCAAGHCSAPSYPLSGNWARPAGGGQHCIRYIPGPEPTRALIECSQPVLYLIDHPGAVSAWLLGGEDAAYAVLKEVATWPTGH